MSVNNVVITPLLSGNRNVILHVYIQGDGSGDLENYVIANPADYGMSGDNRFFTVDGIQAGFTGFSASLKFEYLLSGTLNWAIPEFDSSQDFSDYGGIKDKSSPLDGTGKVLLSTAGLSNGDEGSFVLRLRK